MKLCERRKVVGPASPVATPPRRKISYASISGVGFESQHGYAHGYDRFQGREQAVNFALTELLRVPVQDPGGSIAGRVREVAFCPQDDAARVSALIVRTSSGDRLLGLGQIASINGGIKARTAVSEWPPFVGSEGMLLLTRDLLDQQIIDVHGRKVVRVNDVDLNEEPFEGHVALRMASVDVGARGAVRRLLRGLVPAPALRALLKKIPPRMIPWEFVDLIETDPARRVKLKISHELLAKLHPADIADIIEELAPAEREAVFETLDEEVAADALEEITPKLQRSIVESLDSDRAADIVEEMDPDAAADLLGDLSAETSAEILGEMEQEQRDEVSELLGFQENTAAGRMTTEYMAIDKRSTANDAIEMLRNFEGGIESLSTIYLIEPDEKLVGAVPLSKLVLATHDTALAQLAVEPLISTHAGVGEKEVAELFDKYNLLTLPVVDESGKLTGVITADDIISLLRSKL
jgi:CBS domain-containing protein/sporulation protein YlmC with PRC-barrel domain